MKKKTQITMSPPLPVRILGGRAEPARDRGHRADGPGEAAPDHPAINDGAISPGPGRERTSATASSPPS